MLAVFKIRRGKMPIWHYIMVTIIDVHMYIIYIFFYFIFSLKRPRGLCQCLSQVGSREIMWSIYLCAYHYMHDTTSLLQEETCAVFTPGRVESSWKPDDAIGRQHGKLVITIFWYFCTLLWIEPMTEWSRSQLRDHTATPAPNICI